MKTLIISHSSCVDGWVSAYLMSLVYPDNVIIYQRYHEALDIDHIKTLGIDSIRVVDFSLGFDTIRQLNEITDDIEIYDHHETAAKLYNNGDDCDCRFYDGNKRKLFSLLINREKCASKIIFEKYRDKVIEAYCEKLFDIYVERHGNYNNVGVSCLFFQAKDKELMGNCLESFIDAIDRYDNWSDLTPSVFYINQLVRDTFEKLDSLYSYQRDPFDVLTEIISIDETNQKKSIENLTKYTQNLLDKRNTIVQHYVSNANIRNFHEFGNIPFVSCPSSYVNYVGDELSKLFNFACLYYVNTNGFVKVSLRSQNFLNIDLSEIAARHGGGGHKSAAGFVITLEQFNQLLKESE